MAGSLNKVCLLGNVGKDPEIRNLQSGTQLANLTLATEETWKDKNTGEKKSRTEWHRVVAWGREAESCAQFLRKGQPVYVEGMIRSRKFEAKDGAQRTAFEVHAESVSFLGKMPRSRNAATELDSVVGL